MKIALIQLNYTVGNIEGNVAKIKNGIKLAKAKGADLAVFAELAICGYPPKDLLLQDGFVEKCEKAAANIAKDCKGIAAIIGGPSKNKAKSGRQVFNSAFFMADGKVKTIIHKTLLPFYDVFDEYRYFEPAKENKFITYKGTKIGITICEDIWNQLPDKTGHCTHNRFPLKEMNAGKTDCIINISASPFSYTHWEERRRVACAVAKDFNTPLFYVNNIGTNTDLTFDGDSFVVDKKGNVITELARFEEDLQVFDLEKKKVTCTDRDCFVPRNDGRSPTGINPSLRGSAKQSLSHVAINRERFVPHNNVWYSSKSNDERRITESVYKALVMGIHDFFHKSNIKKAVLGLSGGIDSALVLVLAIAALGKENVTCVILPSKFTSDETMKDAMQLLKNTGVACENISIEGGVKAMNEALADTFKGLKPDITEENIQARLRGLLIMAVANKTGALMLNTSNKSELATGYGTLYGDMGGALAVIGDLYKTQVFRLAEYVNEITTPQTPKGALNSATQSPFRGLGQYPDGIIPKNILTKPPTAELKPNQKDSDSLPEYEILDKILIQYIEEHKSVDKIKLKGADKKLIHRVVSLINKAEFKRHQFAPILRISPKAFGIGRRMPIVGKL